MAKSRGRHATAASARADFVLSDADMINAQLGIELRRLREEAGYTAVEACEPLKAQGPKLSKIENGKQGATPEEVRILCEFYRASNDERDYLVALTLQTPPTAGGQAGCGAGLVSEVPGPGMGCHGDQDVSNRHGAWSSTD